MATDARVQFIIDAENRMDAVWDNVENRMNEIAEVGVTGSQRQQAAEQDLMMSEEERVTTIQTIIDRMQAMALATNTASNIQVAATQEAISLNMDYLEEIGAETSALEQLDAIQTRLANDVRETAQAQKLAGTEAMESYEQQQAGLLNVEAGTMRAARASTGLAFAIGGMGRGGRFAAIQIGMLAQSLAAMSESAAIAEAATGIGALLMVIGGLAMLWEDLNQKEEKALTPVEKYSQTIKNMNFEQVKAEFNKQKQALDETSDAMHHLTDETAWYERIIIHIAEAANDLLGTGHAKDFLKDLLGISSEEQRAFEDTQAKYKAIKDKMTKDEAEAEKQHEETERKITAFMDSQANERQKIQSKLDAQKGSADKVDVANLEIQSANQRAVAEQKVYDAYIQQTNALDEKYEKLMAIKNLTAAERSEIEAETRASHAALQQELNDERANLLMMEQERDIKLQLKALDGDPGTSLKGKLDAIRNERDANIAATNDVTTANKIANQEKLALIDSEIQKSEQALLTIEKATISSHNRTIKAVGEAAKTIRALEIGAEAAKALVKAAIYGAESIAHFAVGDVVGGAGLALAAVEMGAAAAQGFSEAGIGGGGSGGSSGGGGGGAKNQTFTPASGGQGGLTVNLLTRDPYSGDAIQNTVYQINQSQVLDQPINVPPTTGLSPAR